MELKNDINVKEAMICVSSTPTGVDDIIEVDGDIFLLQNKEAPQPTIEPPKPIIIDDI